MKIVTPCKVCGSDMSLQWRTGMDMPPAIHPFCDTRPTNERHRPHPAEGHLTNLTFDATLAMAEAAAGPDSSPAWERFDRISAQLRQVQHNNRYPPLAWAARYYTQGLGWPIFPLQPGGKAPLTRHGFKDATTNPGQIRAWWEANPEANIGIPTGIAFDVIDIDTPVHKTVWDELSAEPELEGHGLASTSGGGYHLFVKTGFLVNHTTSGRVKNAAGVLGKGIDYRVGGGYIVAPFSRLDNKRAWSWWTMPSNQIAGRCITHRIPRQVHDETRTTQHQGRAGVRHHRPPGGRAS